jgi:hypothetical protein
MIVILDAKLPLYKAVALDIKHPSYLEVQNLIETPDYNLMLKNIYVYQNTHIKAK